MVICHFVISYYVILLKYASGPSLTYFKINRIVNCFQPQQHLYLKIDIRYFDKD
jgi:hypothetical protein